MSSGHFQDAERPTKDGRAGSTKEHSCTAMDGSDSQSYEVTNLSSGHFQDAERPTKDGRAGSTKEHSCTAMDGSDSKSYEVTNLSSGHFQDAERPTKAAPWLPATAAFVHPCTADGRAGSIKEHPYIAMDGCDFHTYEVTNLSSGHFQMAERPTKAAPWLPATKEQSLPCTADGRAGSTKAISVKENTILLVFLSGFGVAPAVT